MTTKTPIHLTLEVSPDQLLQALLRLPAAEKLFIAEWLEKSAEVEKRALKKVSFTVLKTEGKFYTFDRGEGNER